MLLLNDVSDIHCTQPFLELLNTLSLSLWDPGPCGCLPVPLSVLLDPGPILGGLGFPGLMLGIFLDSWTPWFRISVPSRGSWTPGPSDLAPLSGLKDPLVCFLPLLWAHGLWSCL